MAGETEVQRSLPVAEQGPVCRPACVERPAQWPGARVPLGCVGLLLPGRAVPVAFMSAESVRRQGILPAQGGGSETSDDKPPIGLNSRLIEVTDRDHV